MAFNLNKLNDELKYGKIVSNNKRLQLLMPLCRLTYPDIVEPKQFQEGQGSFRFSISMLFETDSAKEGCVDLNKVVFPALEAFTKGQSLQYKRTNEGIYLGKSQGHPYEVFHIGPKESIEGKPYAAHSDTTVFMKVNRNAGDVKPTAGWRPIPCVSPTGSKMSPEGVYSGCWGRVLVTFYRPKDTAKYPMIAAGLDRIQFVCDGEIIGSDAYEMGAIDGAEDTSNTAMSSVTGDDDYSDYR